MSSFQSTATASLLLLLREMHQGVAQDSNRVRSLFWKGIHVPVSQRLLAPEYSLAVLFPGPSSGAWV